MRWLWTSLFLTLLFIACNTSSGNNCASAGGTCTFGSCNAYCANGVCSNPLGASAQDCPSSMTNPATNATVSGNPCCVTETQSPAPTPSDDAGADAEPSQDAAVDADSSTPSDAASYDGASDADGAALCPLVDDAGDSGLRMCVPDAGGEDANADAPGDGPSDAPTDG